MASQLTKPYPSDPAKRYRQSATGAPQEGTSQNATFTITLDGSGGSWFCSVNDRLFNRPLLQAISIAQSLVSSVATAAAMQAFFEVQVGSGNVTVTGGPGAAGGGTPYVATFLGELAGQDLILGHSSFFMTGGAATATVVETQRGGRPVNSVPIGPDLSTVNALPTNGPVAREA